MEFTEEEVRNKLTELGYKDVPRSKLLLFMKDLKDLVEEEQSDVQYPNCDSLQYNSSSCSYTSGGGNNYSRTFEPLKDVNKRSSVAFSKEKLSMHENTFLDKENLTTYNDHSDSSFLSSTITSSVVSESESRYHHQSHNDNPCKLRRKVSRKKNGTVRVYDETLTDHDSECLDITDVEERIKNLPYNYSSRLSDNQDTASECSSKSRCSTREPVNKLPAFIRPSSAHPHTKRIQKCDPVNRYHQFKEEWKNNKVPGESKRSTLRWNIREKMLNGDVFEKPQHNYQKNNYVVPTEKKRQALRWQVRTALSRQ